MQTLKELGHHIDNCIIQYDNLLKTQKLTPALVRKYQMEVDKLAENQRSGSNSNLVAKLYELQALVDYSKGDLARAEEFVNEAQTIVGNEYQFLSSTITELVNLNRTRTPHNKSSQVARQYSGRLEGWLALYALRSLAVPLVLVLDINSIRSAKSAFTSQGINVPSDFSALLNFAYIMDALGIIAALYVWYIFFGKKGGARVIIRSFEAYLIIYYLVGVIWVQMLLDRYGISGSNSNSVGQLGVGLILAVIWFSYWTISKRVKATFPSA